jgi:hypothetical protein
VHRRLIGESSTTELALGRLTKEHPDGQDTASERTRERLKSLMEGHGEKADLRSELVRTRWDGSITCVAQLPAPAIAMATARVG